VIVAHSKRTRRGTALGVILTLVLNPGWQFAVAADRTAPQATAPKAPAAPAPKSTTQPPAKKTPAATTLPATPVDGGWPRLYDTPTGGDVLVYQPQVASWDKQAQMVAFSAVSYRKTSVSKAVQGTVKIEATTKVAVNDRLVNFNDMRIVEANFPTAPREEVREITSVITTAIPEDERVIALDRVLASVDKSSIIPRNVEGVKADPPNIFFSMTPAIMVNLDGEPIWSPIRDNDLKYAVNTNWDLFQLDTTSRVYLRNENTWLTAPTVNGPWAPAGTLPASFSKLPADANWTDVKANLPGRALKPEAVPKVFVSTTPGELILLTGAPAYVPVPGTQLQWIRNTDSDLFRMGQGGLVYYLVAGRWFSAKDFNGPWTFATPNLPEDFQKISVEHERSRVLASGPGTDQAVEAVLLAQIPQTARVNKKETKAPEVAFQGDPKFDQIPPTPVQRAANTDKDVFLVNNQYYLCYQGVWFVGTSATGPWTVAESIPKEIYSIPVSSPSHHVTYVTIEEDNDDDWVVFAAAAGYTGMMVAWGCAVWGTGWYYPPYWGYGGFYPYYYPHFATYGYSAWYNPWTGAYGRSARVYGPYGGAGVGARYNPRTGTYARGAAAWGPYGARGAAQAYNPRTGTYAQTRQGSNVYGNWGSTQVQRGDDWASTNRYTNRQTGTTTRTIRTDDGAAITRRGPGGATVGVGDGGNVYAGNDGNVYRRQDGTWQKYDNGSWNNTDRQPSGERPRPNDAGAGANAGGRVTDRGTGQNTTRATTDQLNRDSAARTSGSQRTRDAGSYRSGGSVSTGSYRGGGARGGGGMRGGGGRRR
jgi:hypothetical protein